MTKHSHAQSTEESQEIPVRRQGFSVNVPEWAGKPLFAILLLLVGGTAGWGTGVFQRLGGINDSATLAVESLDNSAALDAAIARASKRGLEEVATQLANSNASAKEWRDELKTQQDTILREVREMQSDVAALKGDVQSLRRDRWRGDRDEVRLPNAVPATTPGQ